MTKMLLIAATLSVAAPAAYACDLHPAGTHASTKVDDTKVASVTTGEAQKMSAPVATSTVVIEDEAAPAQAE